MPGPLDKQGCWTRGLSGRSTVGRETVDRLFEALPILPDAKAIHNVGY